MGWSRKTLAALPAIEGSPIAVREDSVTVGFGLESIAGDSARSGFLKRILLRLVPDLYDVPTPKPTEPVRRPHIYLPLLVSKSGLGS